MTRFGPGRGELWFRLIVSLGGLAAIGVAAAVRPSGRPGSRSWGWAAPFSGAPPSGPPARCGRRAGG